MQETYNLKKGVGVDHRNKMYGNKLRIMYLTTLVNLSNS